VIDLEKLGAWTLNIDCDVLRADGGTRTTAICGAYVALELAIRSLQQKGVLKENPLVAQLAATSVGVVQGEVLLDLNYLEDKDAAVDMNVVMTSEGKFVEVQASGEESTFTPDELQSLLTMARSGLDQIFVQQRSALSVEAK
jgi:ribonuclease PH